MVPVIKWTIEFFNAAQLLLKCDGNRRSSLQFLPINPMHCCNSPIYLKFVIGLADHSDRRKTVVNSLSES